MTFSYITKTSVFGFLPMTIVEDVTLEQYFADCEIVKNFNFFTATKGSIIVVGFMGDYNAIMEKYEKNSLPAHYVYNLIIDIMMQDYCALRLKLHSGNAYSCNIFATITGLKFKLNNKAIDATLRGFCSADSIAMAEAQDARQLERQQLSREEDRKNAIIQAATIAQVRYNGRSVSMCEWLNTLLAQGYTIQNVGGKIHLVNPDDKEGFYNLSKKGFKAASDLARLKLGEKS